MLRPALLAAAAIPVIASAQSTPVAPPPGPPPVLVPVAGVPDKHRQALISWKAGPVTCAGENASPEAMPEPLAPIGTMPVASSGEAKAAEPPRFTFSVDATGRVLDIKPETKAFVSYGNDIVPSLAAARFPPGRPLSGCSVEYARTAESLATADLEDLIAYTVFPSGRPPQAVWDRIKPAGSTCMEDAPPPLTRVFPNFEEIPQRSGTLGWTLVGYDIDERGRTVRVRRVAGSGNEVLDREAVEAIESSTFTPGKRQGCLYPYWRRGKPLAAPEAPDLAAYRPADAKCPETMGWAREPRLTFPEPYRRRGIEGWAVVAYDVAPWGEIGNMRVLAAQPAAAFGEAAMNVLRAASKPPSAQGATGCVDRVRFVTAPAGSARVGGEGPVPVES